MRRKRRRVSVAVVGAGMSGICIAAKLLDSGLDAFTIYEKGDDYGGTWRENTYPGLSCDVPAPFYTYSFAPNPEWTHRFAAGAEIHRYLRSVAARYALAERTCFKTEIVSCVRDGDKWRLRSATGTTYSADVLVAATGVLHHPRIPDIPGLESFAGTPFHSARWDHSVALDGARIGVIGTGSTGVQIVTALAHRAAHLTHFQRTAQWLFPFPNAAYSPSFRRAQRRWPVISRWLYRFHQTWLESFFIGLIKPGARRWLAQSACRWNLQRVRDPELRARLTPSYEPMCKRLVLSSGYYPAVQRPNVDVVTDPISRITPAGVLTADGREHPLDVLVLATGFDAHAYLRPMEVVGEQGVTLEQAWRDGPVAHRTLAIPGFPNLFLLLGPNSPIGNTSLFPIAEAQADAILRFVRRMSDGQLRAVSPTPVATRAFQDLIRNHMEDTVWVSGCDSWYLGPDGTPILWPFPPKQFYEMLAALPDGEFVLQTTANSATP